MLILLALLSTADAGRGKRLPAPPNVPPPSIPSDQVNADTLPRAPLQGRVAALELTSLSRTTITYTIEHDLSELASPTEDDVAVLLRHFAADPRWRVVSRDGALHALPRQLDKKVWRADPSGFSNRGSEVSQLAVRLGPGSNPLWDDSELVARVDPSSGRIRMQGYSARGRKWGGCTSSAMTIGAPPLAVDLYECASEDERPATARTLATLPPLVAGLKSRASEVRSKGYAKPYLPRKEPARGKQPSLLLESNQPGTLDVTFRINPPGAGWTWARILTQELEPWEADAMGAGTREFLGWSNSPRELFYGHSRVDVTPGEAFSGSVEVWFLPIGETKPKRIAAFLANVPAR